MSDEAPQLRRLKVDLKELVFAFEDHSRVGRWFLDLQTGQAIYVSEETREQLRSLEDEFGEEPDPDSPQFRDAVAQLGLPDWEAEALEQYARIGAEFGGRYRSVEPDDSSEGYRDMEDFIETVSSRQLQERLSRAIQGRGAFRRFQDVIDGSAERQRWFEFRDARRRQRVVDWLRDEGVEAI